MVLYGNIPYSCPAVKRKNKKFVKKNRDFQIMSRCVLKSSVYAPVFAEFSQIVQLRRDHTAIWVEVDFGERLFCEQVVAFEPLGCNDGKIGDINNAVPCDIARQRANINRKRCIALVGALHCTGVADPDKTFL